MVGAIPGSMGVGGFKHQFSPSVVNDKTETGDATVMDQQVATFGVFGFSSLALFGRRFLAVGYLAEMCWNSRTQACLSATGTLAFWLTLYRSSMN